MSLGSNAWSSYTTNDVVKNQKMQAILAAAEEQGRHVGLVMRQKELDNERRIHDLNF